MLREHEQEHGSESKDVTFEVSQLLYCTSYDDDNDNEVDNGIGIDRQYECRTWQSTGNDSTGIRLDILANATMCGVREGTSQAMAY